MENTDSNILSTLFSELNTQSKIIIYSDYLVEACVLDLESESDTNKKLINSFLKRLPSETYYVVKEGNSFKINPVIGCA